MILRDLAHARVGNKGNTSKISVIARDSAEFGRLERGVTAERVRAHFTGIVDGEACRCV